jgi:hypothetical protein
VANFVIRPDSRLSGRSEAFGAYIAGNEVFIPSEIVRVLEGLSIGENPGTVAGYLASFPTAVAAALRLSPTEVVNSANDLLSLLRKAGVEGTSKTAQTVSHGRGARHPGELSPSRVRSTG